MKNKKLKKWAIPLAVVVLGGTPLALAACNNGNNDDPPPSSHTHEYTAWDYTQSEHWKYCPEDDEIDETTREAHDPVDESGKCPECGYQLFEYIDQATKLVLRKAGANTDLASLDGVTIAISQGGKTLVEGTDYTLEKGEGGALKIKRIVLGDYRIAISTADGQYSFSGVVGFDGMSEKEIVLQYKYAVATEKPDKIDLSLMNETTPVLKIKSGSAGLFDYWNGTSDNGGGCPAITLALSDADKQSLDVTFEFNMKATDPNNGPNNTFGIVMAEGYKGVAVNIWDTANPDDGVVAYPIKGNYLGGSDYQADSKASLKWIETGIYSADGVDFKAMRKGGTIKLAAKNTEGEYEEIFSVECGAVVANDIKFMAAGSNYTLTVKSLTAVEFVEETVAATFSNIGNDTFDVDGVELTFAGRHTYTGTAQNHTLTISDMAVGDYNVTATVNGLTVSLGRATVTKDGNDETKGIGTLELDGRSIFAKAEAAAAGFSLKDLAITLDLKNGGNAYHNKLVTSVPESNTNYILYKISLPDDVKTKLTDASKKINFSMPIVINGGENAFRFIIQNGEVKYKIYGGGVKDAMGDFDGKEISLGSDFWTALTSTDGDGIYLVANIDKTEKTLHIYLGTDLTEMKLASDYALFTVPITSIGISMGNAVDMSIDDGSKVTVALKYGTTMAAVGADEAETVTLTGKLSDDSPAGKGRVDIASGIHYVGDKCVVTVTTEPGYSLKSIKVGNGVAITSGWTQKGNVYTIEINVPDADADVVASLEESPTVATADIVINAANGFTADGAELTFKTPGFEWTGTVTDGKVTIGEASNPVVLGSLAVSATVNGFTLNLGNVTVAKTAADQTKGEGTLTLDSAAVLVKSESELSAFDLKDLAITLDLRNGGNAYHNKVVANITASENNYILYKISLTQDMKTALTSDSNKKLNISMPLLDNGKENSTIKFEFKNGEVLSSFWGGAVEKACGSFFSPAKDLGSDFWTALTEGDGFYMIAYIHKTDKTLRVYTGTDLTEMKLTDSVIAKYENVVNTIDIAMGNAVDAKSMSDGDTVTVALKYGTTLGAVGATEAAKHTVTTSIAEESASMGSIADGAQRYVNTDYTVTITANAGNELKSLTVGGTAVDLNDVTKNGLTYTYTFKVTADTAVVAEFKQAATVDTTFTASGEGAPADGTAIKLTNTSTNVVTNAVIGTSIALEPGTYKLFVYGYIEQEVTVSDGGEKALTLVKTMAYGSSDKVTVDDTNKTITIAGEGASDRTQNRTKNAEYVLTAEQKTSQDLTLTFNLKRDASAGVTTEGGNAWAAKRAGVQIGSGNIGFFFFFRTTEGGSNTAIDVSKLGTGSNIPLDLNPGDGEQKWHNEDQSLAWVVNAAHGESGLTMKVVRTGGSIKIYAQNTDGSWECLNSSNNPTLEIGDNVENEIKFVSGGDTYIFSAITVETTAWTIPATPAGD